MVIGFCFIGFFVVAFGGCVLHFVYDWLNHCRIFSLFVAVNESTWEHLKLAVFPLYIWSFVGGCLEINNLALGTLVAILVVMVMIPVIFYSYTHFTHRPILTVDISSFFVSVMFAMGAAFCVFNVAPVPEWVTILSVMIECLVALCFIVFTFWPPHLCLFRDPISHKFGVKGHFDDARYGNHYTIQKPQC